MLLVVFYHAKLFSIESGHLGVDIFFVISGFLITHQIAQKVISNAFSFKVFYRRRAWRLLPAAYTVFLLTSSIAPFVLPHSELINYAQQLFGALSFTANFVLYQQTGYFSTAAELKLLLHTWSLSIEEQYYIAVPVLLAVFKRKHWLLLIATISGVSLYLFFSINANASFYFTFTRCWELGAGTILAISFLNSERRPPSWFAYPAFISLLFIVFDTSELIPPKVELVFLILATMTIIGCNAKHLNSGFLVHGLAKVGAISYSLYLCHWPIMALINNLNVSNQDLPSEIKITSVVLSFISAVALHHFVEKRFRHHRNVSQRSIISLVLMTSALLAIGLAFIFIKPTQDHSFQMRNNDGFSINCSKINFFELAECSNAKRPEMLVWGDSFAMHLIAGLALSDKGVMQATKTTCLPIKDIGFFHPPSFERPWSQSCIEFNSAVLNYLKIPTSIKTVVMASPWRHLLNLNTHIRYTDNQYTQIQLNNMDVADEMLHTANQIRKQGIKVVIVAPPPRVTFNIGRCHEKLSRNQIKIGGGLDCSLDYNEYQKFDEKVNKLIHYLESKGETMYSFKDNLCTEKRCETALDGIVLYRDNGHFSYAGAEKYAQKFKLYDTLSQMAK